MLKQKDKGGDPKRNPGVPECAQWAAGQKVHLLDFWGAKILSGRGVSHGASLN